MSALLIFCLVSQQSHEACRHPAQFSNEEDIWLNHVDSISMAASTFQHSTSTHSSNVSINQSYGQNSAASELPGVWRCNCTSWSSTYIQKSDMVYWAAHWLVSLLYEAWKEDWFKKEVSNQFLVTDPAICLPGFDLERKDGHGLFSTVFALAMASVLLLTMTVAYVTTHSVPAEASKQCYTSSTNARWPSFRVGLQALHSAEEDSCSWLRKLSIR